MAYPTVNFKQQSGFMGSQSIDETSTTQRHALGEIIRATDFTYGAGEFIYLVGAASTAKGDLVCYNSKTGATVRAVHGGATSTGSVAIAMSDNIASQYGWYQVEGSGPVSAATVAANVPLYLTSTAGQVDDAAVTGDLIDGLTSRAATSGNFATCQINRPNVSSIGGSGSNSADVTVTTIGSSANANGMTLAGQVLNLEPASASFGGIVTTGTQTFAGAKSFSSTATLASVILTEAQGSSIPTTTGFTTVTNGKSKAAVTNIEIDYTAWIAAALTQDISLIVLPAGARIVAFYADTTIAYAGLAGTIQLKVGISAGGGEVIAAYDCKSATVTKGLLDADMGTAMTRAALIQGAYLPSWSATTTINVRLTSGTGNIGDGATTSNLSAGRTRFRIQLELK